MAKKISKIPEHIAILMDGNRRWATEKGVPTLEGHRTSAENLELILEKAKDLGIKCLTLWAFSTENWNRSDEEKKYLFNLISEFSNRYYDKFIKQGVRFVHIGRKDRLDEKTLGVVEKFEQDTDFDTDCTVVLALDYGGHDELTRAFEKVQEQNLEITAANIEKNLDTADLPQIDLIIRTGGEVRLSGFMAWQSAYAELMFMDKYFPDFTTEDLETAVKEFSNRERRFGGDSNK